MRSLIIPTLLCVLFIHKSCATIHTQCYNYFLNKDGCVYATADNRTRCPLNPKPQTAVKVIEEGKKIVKRHTLERRYDTTLPSPSVLGKGICGDYNTTNTEGASLWVGNSYKSKKPEEAGWLNKAKKSNCNKRLYIINPASGETIYVNVIDGKRSLYVEVMLTRFLNTIFTLKLFSKGHDFKTTEPEVGCFQIALTQKTFLRLKPSKEEIAKGSIKFLKWDFDNIQGISPRQGPV
ncbi:hypothetical protein PPACK8108_LOCUS6144 [Phakopsora pachyrhizi]|uniref:Secreted protein n=1 Tax=Phakopsora pachyrhizi TaxID=170000 RepID=A0AAV0ASC6_PHAPC|nr:hypothetical protein PPACK8108_LOCUS6144 [Phakopsora pachyrhizi]